MKKVAAITALIIALQGILTTGSAVLLDWRRQAAQERLDRLNAEKRQQLWDETAYLQTKIAAATNPAWGR